MSKGIVGGQPWKIATGDVNNDGVPDGLSANTGSSNFSIVLADSGGNLSQPVNYPTGSFPLAIDVGDIDGDGDLEVVTSNFSTADYTLYENDGNGNFINRRNFAADSAGSCAVLHDRDNDGDMDLTGIDEIADLLILFVNDNSVSVGNEVAILVNEQLSPGEYEVEFNTRATHPLALASGIYFYQLKIFSSAESGIYHIETKKMILLK